MIIKKIIKITGIDAHVLLLITDNTRKAVESLNKLEYNIDVSDMSITTQGLSGYSEVDGKIKFYCIVRLDPSLKTTLTILVHELYHTNQDLLEFKGVKYRKADANESYAYTLDYLFGEAYESIVKIHDKKYNKTTK